MDGHWQFVSEPGAGAFSLGLISYFSRTLEEEGAWTYRWLLWETGLIGQVLHLEAEAVGVKATGIGWYFDVCCSLLSASAWKRTPGRASTL